MSGELGSVTVSYVDIKGRPSSWDVPSGYFRLWVNSNDNNNLYARDQLGNNIQISDNGALATGNAQYMWDFFENGIGVTIPNYSAVRLLQGGANDGKIALSDNDAINEDNFLGLVYGGAIGAGQTGTVIYGGKVPNAVQGLGLDSNTIIYMSSTPGVFTSTPPGFAVATVFQIGFTKGDDIYLRPRLLSGL